MSTNRLDGAHIHGITVRLSCKTCSGTWLRSTVSTILYTLNMWLTGARHGICRER